MRDYKFNEAKELLEKWRDLSGSDSFSLGYVPPHDCEAPCCVRIGSRFAYGPDFLEAARLAISKTKEGARLL